jgi:hypothetical protein
MASETQALVAEAGTLGLFKPQAAFEVHCSNCHGRLDGRGDCPTCGVIGRAQAEIERRALTDPVGTTKLLRAAIERRKAYRPAGREKTAER